jgi:hypothetical protein
MKQETVFSMFCGALATVAAYGLFKAGKWTTVAVENLTTGLGAIAPMAYQNQKLTEASLQVATELQLLRSVVAGNTPAEQTEDPEEDASGGTTAAPRPKKPDPFPPAPLSMFRTVAPPPAPDATEEDTEIEDTPDERMVAYERLEELRQQGIEADPEELQDGLLGQV